MQSKHGPQSTSPAHRFKDMTTPVTAAATLTEIAVYDVSAIDFLYLAITVAVAAITDFQVNASAINGGTKVDISGTVLTYGWGTATLTTLVAGTHGALLDVRGMAEVQIKCKSGGTATVLLAAGGN